LKTVAEISIKAGGLTRRSTKTPWAALFVALLSFQVQCFAQVHQADKDGPLEPREQGTKWGYIDRDGQFVIPPQFDEAGPFSEGLAAVEQNRHTGYIDTNGRFVVSPKYFSGGRFKEGFVWVVTRKPFNLFGTGEYGVPIFGKVTFIDRTGREMVRPFFVEQMGDFSEGLAAVRPGKTWGGCSEKVGYINTTGEWGIKPQFDEARDFSEGLAAVNKGAGCHSGGKWGYIDRDGKLAIPFRYDFAWQFKNGHACIKEGTHWKRIDKNGNGAAIREDEC
jgi:hypothetical protein